MKNFYQFIQEDFSSQNATQFTLKIVNQALRGRKDGTTAEVMIFYEHINGSSMNLDRFSKSFMKTDVMSMMNNPDHNWRVLIYKVIDGFDVFVWKSSIMHNIISKALDSNKNLKKYPDIKYSFLYNESQLLMKGDTIGQTWCFSLVIFNGSIISNISTDALNIINDQKGLSNLFKLSDIQVRDLLTKQQCHL